MQGRRHDHPNDKITNTINDRSMHKSSIRTLVVALLLSGGYSLSASAQIDTLTTKPKAVEKKQEPKKEEKKKEEKAEKEEKKKKEETPYTKFFKDKKVESARGKFVSLHKIDGEVFLELPTKYLGQELMMGATITSTTDPDYLAVGSKNSAPFVFRLEKQDSVIVMKAPNTLVYRRDASRQLQQALELNYRDPVVMSFTPKVYTADSSAVVLSLNSLVTESNPFFEIIPKEQGPYKLSSSSNGNLTFIRGLKAFDTNASVKVEMNFSVTASLMGVLTVAKDMPLTAEVTYTILPVKPSQATPRLADARVGYETSRKVSFPDYLDQSEPVYLAHRWCLVPKDKKAYAKGALVEPEKKITFYLDNAFPTTWAKAVREGVLRWNKAFEAAGFRNVIEVRDFPRDKDFDPDNLEYSTIRYIPNSQETVSGASWFDPRTGEIFNASLLIYNNVESLLHKQRFITTAAVDPAVRSSRLPEDRFLESLSALVTQEVGKTLGLLNNYAASTAYSTANLRSAKFTSEQGLAPSIMDGEFYNYVAQPSDKGVRLINNVLGEYDRYAIEWGYRYFPEDEGDPAREAKRLVEFVNKKVANPIYRYAPRQTYSVDPTVRTEDLGDDHLMSSTLGMKNLAIIRSHLEQWIQNDPDSRKKKAMYLTVVQQYYLYLKNVMSLVGGVVTREARLSTGLPRYQVVPKAKQREAFQWILAEAKRFQSYADRSLERKLPMDVSYFDQLLEFINNDILNLRARIIIASQVDKNSYSLGEYFDDLYKAIFASTIAGTAPNHMERFMQRNFIDKAVAGATNARQATPNMPYGFTSGPVTMDMLRLSASAPTDFSTLLSRGRLSYGGGDPSANIYPMANVPALDTSDQYFYAALVKIRPILEQRASSTTDRELRAHYQTLAFKVKKLLDDKK